MNVYHSYRDLVKVRYTNRQLGNNETHFIVSRAAVVRLFFFTVNKFWKLRNHK